MMNNKHKGETILITVGLLMLAAALLLTGYNLFDEYRAGTAAEHILEEMRRQAPNVPQEDSPPCDGTDICEYVLNPDIEMPVINIEENDYIGVLEIPSLELSLPVMSEWSYPKLNTAPCRYAGSVYTGMMVIAGHNYRTHFGDLKSLAPGARIKFTDMQGNSFFYETAAVEVLSPAAAEELLNEEWALTLFTCTPDGQNRVAVRCVKL